MSTRTSSQANLQNARPRKRQKKSSSVSKRDWNPSSNEPIPLNTDGFVYNSTIKDLSEFHTSTALQSETSVPSNVPSHVYLVSVLDRRPKQSDITDTNTISNILDRSDGYEYYVHFYAFDRRLDDWFDRTQFRCHLSDELRTFIDVRDKTYRNANYNDECEFKEDQLRTHQEHTKIKNFSHIVIGKYMVKAWYFSPVPLEYRTSPVLHFCDFCLSFFGQRCEYEHHMKLCMARHPPGNEIYRNREQNIEISVYEIDGAKEEVYCQNIAYLAKFFLDHKTLEFDTTSFFFYVITEVSQNGCHFLCYFSKEKTPEKNFNLSCIMALPCHQRKGLGHFMISLSYGLSKIEQKNGTPETPLSDLGLISYRKFWASELLKVIQKYYREGKMKQLSLMQLANATAFQCEDIFFTLTDLGVLKKCNDEYVFVVNEQIFEKFIRQPKQVKYRQEQYINIVIQDKIHWSPHYYKTQESS